MRSDTTSASHGVVRFARHSVRGGSRGNFCVGARIVATATAWVHRGSVQLANTTIGLITNKRITGRFVEINHAFPYQTYRLYLSGNKRLRVPTDSCFVDVVLTKNGTFQHQAENLLHLF